ncbi:MAG: DinB family protein [bacterium]|nr:DinB family protein [bacterium]
MNNPETAGREIFPEYATLPDMFADEVRGLSEAQIDRRYPEKSWGGWSIREQVSHTAWIPYLLFAGHWREILFPESAPPRADRLDTGGADRMLDPKRFHEMRDLLAVFREGCAMAWDLLEKETPGSMQEKILTRETPGDRTWASGESVRDYFEKLVLPAHGPGIRRDKENPDIFYQTLESAFRHFIWEAYVHLKTIQMYRRSFGLPPVSDVPEVGFIPFLTWE